MSVSSATICDCAAWDRTINFSDRAPNNPYSLLYRAYTKKLGLAPVAGDYDADRDANSIDYAIWRGMFGQTGFGRAADGSVNQAVDAADYVLWRKNNNTAITLPNDATPGTDQSDYTVWRAHFGQSGGSGAGANTNAAVPEPAAAIMLMVAVAVACLLRRLAA